MSSACPESPLMRQLGCIESQAKIDFLCRNKIKTPCRLYSYVCSTTDSNMLHAFGNEKCLNIFREVKRRLCLFKEDSRMEVKGWTVSTWKRKLASRTSHLCSHMQTQNTKMG